MAIKNFQYFQTDSLNENKNNYSSHSQSDKLFFPNSIKIFQFSSSQI